MKIYIPHSLLTIASVLSVGCPNSTPSADSGSQAEVLVDDALVQFSLISALAAGDYGDGVPLHHVLAGGDFGIGTFHQLNGEMIVLDGEIYQALADGSIRKARLDDTTPFAAVTYFKEDGQIEKVAAATLADLDGQLDRKLKRRNSPYALRIDAEFSELTLRSVPAQSPPFQPLIDVVKHQVTWEHRNVRGTLVGLRCPEWIGTLNVSGYHWHFISADRAIGGHVLACAFQDGLLRFDECTSLLIHIPQSSDFDEFQAHGVVQQEINAIERQHSASRAGRD